MQSILVSKQKWLVVSVIAVFALVLLGYHVGKPFFGAHDFNNAIYGNMARNIVRYGVVATKLGQPLNSGPVVGNGFSFHTHHPPLLIYSLALFYSIIGISELSTRLVPIFYSTGTLIALYIFLKNRFSRRVAVSACFLALPTPLFIYYGKNAVQEILVVFFFVVAMHRYFLYLAQKSKTALGWLVISILLGLISGWAGYFSVVALIFLHIVYQRKIDPLVVILLVLPLLTFALHLFHNALLTGSAFGGGFSDVFSLRSSGVNLSDYAKREWGYFSVLFTRPLLLLSLIGLISSLRSKKWPLVFSFMLFGVLYILLFKTGGIRHDYLIYPLLPFVVMTAALGVQTLFGRSKYLFALAACLLVISIALSSYRYTEAILVGDRYRESVAIGKYLQTHTNPRDKTLVLIDNHNVDFEPWLMVFYADRDLRALYKDASAKEKLSSYDYILDFTSTGHFDMYPEQRIKSSKHD